MGKTFKQEPEEKQIVRKWGRSMKPKALKKATHHRERRACVREIKEIV